MARDKEEEEVLEVIPEPPVVHTTECEHNYVDCGIQITGERMVRCSMCWFGMELEKKHTVLEGKVIWA